MAEDWLAAVTEDARRRRREFNQILRDNPVTDTSKTRAVQAALVKETERRFKSVQDEVIADIRARNYRYRLSPAGIDDAMDSYMRAYKRNVEETSVRGVTSTTGRPWTTRFVLKSIVIGAREGRPWRRLEFETALAGDLLGSDVRRTTLTAALVNGRIFNGMDGIGQAERSMLNAILSEASFQGSGIEKIEAAIKAQFDWMPKWRAHRIARTEMIYARNLSYLQSTKDIEIAGKPLKYVWIAAYDARRTHAARRNRIFSAEQVQALIGEPNCRCTSRAISPNDKRYDSQEESIDRFLH